MNGRRKNEERRMQDDERGEERKMRGRFVRFMSNLIQYKTFFVAKGAQICVSQKKVVPL